MRRLRLTIIIFALVILVLAGGGIYLWFIGGETLANQVAQKQTAAANLAITPPPSTESINQPTYSPLPSYQLQDIPTSPRDDQATLTNYGRAVGEIMSVYNNKTIENDLVLVNKAVEKTDPLAAAKLSASANRHATAMAQLKALVVPPSAVQVHLNLINNLIGLAESSYLMAQIDQAPVTALESAQVYPTRLKSFSTAVNNLNFFLLASDVVLPEKDRIAVSLGL
ncbi:MAG: hypothetical protein V1704_02155 [Candidatus Vogelbacteria bacterium]